MFVNKKFVNEGLITKITKYYATKIWGYKVTDLYRKVMVGDVAKVYEEKDKNLREIVFFINK